MGSYYEIKISAENQEQADNIMDTLLSEHLVTGGQFISHPSRFLWKGKVIDMDYITIVSYTKPNNIEAIYTKVRSTTEEEVPMITLTKIDELNEELASWIDDTLS